MEDRSNVEKVVITPNMAKLWLSYSKGNRNISKARVNQLVNDIKRGDFAITNDMIVFAQDGTLINGHHRLTACIEANMDITCYVMYGASLDMIGKIDIGKSRDMRDTLKMYNIQFGTNYAYETECTSCAKLLITYHKTNGLFNNAHDKIWRNSPMEVLDFIKRNYENLKRAAMIVHSKKGFRNDLRYPTAHVCAVYVAFEVLRCLGDLEYKINQFYEDITSQIGLEPNTIQYALLRSMRMFTKRTSDKDRCEMFLLALHAIKYYVTSNKSILRIRITEEERQTLAQYAKYII